MVCPKDYHIFRCIARYAYKDNELEFDHISARSRDRVVRTRDLTGEQMHDQVSDEAGMFAWPPSVMSKDEDPSLEYELSAL
ncbi:Hypothetical predicted protein [Olea europaea subsp. europaea]|uniref:Uncharacterized protein n=1 Tax=Olea europaea subsp. europaea TaxID=158383 RepID=A0A8S0VFA6_OLEEU|nr:Hypothetical predicted protein [Olea europaea subsp. europaea]